MRDALVIIFAVLLTAGIVYAGGLGIDLTVELTSTGGGAGGEPPTCGTLEWIDSSCAQWIDTNYADIID